MNALLTQLLDPVGFGSHISAVESTPQALRVMHGKRKQSRMPLSYTSPLIRYVVGDPRSRETKAILTRSRGSSLGGPSSRVFSLLTPPVRSKLLLIIAQHRRALRSVPRPPAAPAATSRPRLRAMTPPPSSTARAAQPILAPELEKD
ncbi:hypothetical protein DIPPA_31787 [Diplonema papillatum]|nr:hypothetical protein DIPPA_31787 [Diplonema papillatum]